jgi:hypothetical protein
MALSESELESLALSSRGSFQASGSFGQRLSVFMGAADRNSFPVMSTTRGVGGKSVHRKGSVLETI